MAYMNNLLPGMDPNDQILQQLLAEMKQRQDPRLVQGLSMSQPANPNLPPPSQRGLTSGDEEKTMKQKAFGALGSDAMLGMLSGLLGGFMGDDGEKTYKKEKEKDRAVQRLSIARGGANNATQALLQLQALLANREGRGG